MFSGLMSRWMMLYRWQSSVQRDDGVILAADDVGRALELAHEPEFLHDVLGHAAEKGLHGLVVQALGADALDLALAGGDGHDLDRGGVGGAEILPVGLPDPAEGPLAQQPDQRPVVEYDVADFVCTVHRNTSGIHFEAARCFFVRQDALKEMRAPVRDSLLLSITIWFHRA